MWHKVRFNAVSPFVAIGGGDRVAVRRAWALPRSSSSWYKLIAWILLHFVTGLRNTRIYLKTVVWNDMTIIGVSMSLKKIWHNQNLECYSKIDWEQFDIDLRPIDVPLNTISITYRVCVLVIVCFCVWCPESRVSVPIVKLFTVQRAPLTSDKRFLVVFLTASRCSWRRKKRKEIMSWKFLEVFYCKGQHRTNISISFKNGREWLRECAQ